MALLARSTNAESSSCTNKPVARPCYSCEYCWLSNTRWTSRRPLRNVSFSRGYHSGQGQAVILEVDCLLHSWTACQC